MALSPFHLWSLFSCSERNFVFFGDFGDFRSDLLSVRPAQRFPACKSLTTSNSLSCVLDLLSVVSVDSLSRFASFIVSFKSVCIYQFGFAFLFSSLAFAFAFLFSYLACSNHMFGLILMFRSRVHILASFTSFELILS